MINPLTFIGRPRKFQDKFYVYPPTVKEVLENPYYNQFVRLLTIDQDDIRDDLTKKDQYTNIPTPFEFLLANCFNSKQFEALSKEAFRFFIHEDINFFYEEKMIVVGNLAETVQHIKSLNDLITIKEEDYFDFQNYIRDSIGEKNISKPELPNPNEDPRVTRIKAKARERDRIKAKQNSKNGISLTVSLTAICCMGLGLTPLNIGEMSYASIGPIMNMMQDKEKYDVDIRSLLAGADSKKIKPKYWIRDNN